MTFEKCDTCGKALTENTKCQCLDETVNAEGDIVRVQTLRCYKCAGMEPDWTSKCEVCGQSPIVPRTGMCGPCTFGDSSTIHGDW